MCRRDSIGRGGTPPGAAPFQMTDPAHTPHTPHTLRPHRASHRRLIALGAALLALAALAAAVAATRDRDRPAGAAAAPLASASPTERPFLPTDRAVKMRLLEALDEPPQLLIFGGSRATRFEPSYLRELTGLRGFNLALQNGRPEDAWAFTNLIHERHPGTGLHVVWFLHVEAFREQGLSAGLIQDPALARWFPRSLVERERARLPQTAADLPKGRDLALTEYGQDGAVLRNRYDLEIEKGRTLERAVDWTINEALQRYKTTAPALFPRSQTYFEKTIRALNEDGTKPVIVFMPLHPRLLAAVKPAGWSERHGQVMGYLRDLQDELDFAVLDFSVLSSFGGDPQGFYDGFHIRKANARRLLDAVVAQAPGSFE